MEDLIQTVIAIVFIGVALVFKLMEMASRKKMPLPLPQMEPQEDVFEELETRSEPKVEPRLILEKVKSIHEPKIPKKISIPVSEELKFSLDELQKGIILSVILGPPKSHPRRITAR